MGYIPKIYNKVILLIALIISIYMGMFVVSGLYDINKSIDKYNYISNKQISDIENKKICSIFKCTAIKDNEKIIYYDKGESVLKGNSKSNKFNLYEDIYYDETYMSLIYKIDYNKYVYFNLINDYNKKYAIIISTLPLIIFIFIYVIFSTIKEEQEELIVSIAGNEALLANKAMINITENIHHELNTPLEVIDNKIEKIHRIINSFTKDEECYTEEGLTLEARIEKMKKIKRLEDDFGFIKTSSEQIYSVLEKMKGFKNLKYSNGNKSIKDIIDGGFKIINISNTNFDYFVDEKLSKYSLDSEILKNADLLSIILNHIKNSLEANASKIHIIKNEYKHNEIKIRVLDNGNGIPKSAQKNIFRPNFSTKSSEDGIRGNGMYLNQHILQAAGGNIKLIGSSSQGTTLELTIPCKERELKKES